MKKGISVILMFAWAASVLAQTEMAMAYNPMDDPVELSARPAATASPVIFRTTTAFKPLLNPVDIDSSFFKPELPVDKITRGLPPFGYGITYAQDTLGGFTLINLDKIYQELVVFVKDQDGRMVLAQLFQKADRAKLDIPGEGPFRIEILTNKGDKATLDVPAY